MTGIACCVTWCSGRLCLLPRTWYENAWWFGLAQDDNNGVMWVLASVADCEAVGFPSRYQMHHWKYEVLYGTSFPSVTFWYEFQALLENSSMDMEEDSDSCYW